MNGLLIRLVLLGSRGSWGRPAAIVAGIALGMTIFLLLLGAFNGLDDRDARSAWLHPSGTLVADAQERGQAINLTNDSALVASNTDFHDGRSITHLRIATTPDSSVTIPGVSGELAEGDYWASPALAQLIDGEPRSQLGARYGTRAGILPESTLPSPDSLVVLEGSSEESMRGDPGARLISAFVGEPLGESESYRTILGIGAIGVFFPVVLFVRIVTQLGAAQRQERYSTLRLIGASPRTVARMIGVETAATSLLGAALGVGLADLVRPLATRFPLNGESFFRYDFNVPVGIIVLSVVTMVVVSTLSAMWGTHKSGIGPLGATRQQREAVPKPRLLVPLLAGLAMLGLSVSMQPEVVSWLFMSGFLFVTVGIVAAGPWITHRVSGHLARRARTAASIIATRRIRATPAATFRSISGLVIAVFVVSVFAGIVSAVEEMSDIEDGAGLLPVDGLLAIVHPDDGNVLERVDALETIEGVQSVVVGFSPANGETDTVHVIRKDAQLLGFATVPDSHVVSFSVPAILTEERGQAARLVSTLHESTEELDPRIIVVRTDNSPETIERARTMIMSTFQHLERGPMTRAESANMVGVDRILNELAVLAYLGTVFTIALAGCSLAIATAGAILDRKRMLGLLRLMGMPVANLRRIVTYEAAVPIATVLGIATCLGFLVAWLAITGLSSLTMQWPDGRYFVTIAIGILFAALAVTATFGTIRKGTAVGSTRFE